MTREWRVWTWAGVHGLGGGGWWRRVVGADGGMVRTIVAAADLFLGAGCPGCGIPELGVCRACGSAMVPDPMQVETRHPVGAPVVAGQRYDGPLRRTILAWKEQGRTPLTGLLAHHVAAAVLGAAPPAPVHLVPVPSTRLARHRRGTDVVRDLSDAAAGVLGDLGVRAVVVPVLGHVGRVLDQAALGADDRMRNLRGALRCRGRVPARGGLVVVDDVVTTGATAAEAVRALGRLGHPVDAVAAVAATT